MHDAHCRLRCRFGRLPSCNSPSALHTCLRGGPSRLAAHPKQALLRGASTDSDEACRSAARAALATMPLPAATLLPLLTLEPSTAAVGADQDMRDAEPAGEAADDQDEELARLQAEAEAATAAAAAAKQGTPRSKQKRAGKPSKEAATAEAAAVAAADAVERRRQQLAEQRQARQQGRAAAEGGHDAAGRAVPAGECCTAVLELLQWKENVHNRLQLVPAVQAVLSQLLTALAGEQGEEGVDGEQAPLPALAGMAANEAMYVVQLCLAALAGMARSARRAAPPTPAQAPALPTPAGKVKGKGRRKDAATAAAADQQHEALHGFDLGLAVRAAQQAPDGAARNAALELVAELALGMPEVRRAGRLRAGSWLCGSGQGARVAPGWRPVGVCQTGAGRGCLLHSRHTPTSHPPLLPLALQAALAHVLEVVAVVGASAALQEDEQSERVRWCLPRPCSAPGPASSMGGVMLAASTPLPCTALQRAVLGLARAAACDVVAHSWLAAAWLRHGQRPPAAASAPPPCPCCPACTGGVPSAARHSASLDRRGQGRAGVGRSGGGRAAARLAPPPPAFAGCAGLRSAAGGEPSHCVHPHTHLHPAARLLRLQPGLASSRSDCALAPSCNTPASPARARRCTSSADADAHLPLQLEGLCSVLCLLLDQGVAQQVQAAASAAAGEAAMSEADTLLAAGDAAEEEPAWQLDLAGDLLAQVCSRAFRSCRVSTPLSV